MKPEIAAEAPTIGTNFAAMRPQMRGSSRRRRHGERMQKSHRAEAARDRRAERQQPDRVEPEMRPVAVDQRVGDEGPDVRAEPAGKRAALRGTSAS